MRDESTVREVISAKSCLVTTFIVRACVFWFIIDQDVLSLITSHFRTYLIWSPKFNLLNTSGTDTSSDGRWDRIVTYVRDGPPPKSKRLVCSSSLPIPTFCVLCCIYVRICACVHACIFTGTRILAPVSAPTGIKIQRRNVVEPEPRAPLPEPKLAEFSLVALSRGVQVL